LSFILLALLLSQGKQPEDEDDHESDKEEQNADDDAMKPQQVILLLSLGEVLIVADHASFLSALFISLCCLGSSACLVYRVCVDFPFLLVFISTRPICAIGNSKTLAFQN
jgi:hypothetical protein